MKKIFNMVLNIAVTFTFILIFALYLTVHIMTYKWWSFITVPLTFVFGATVVVGMTILTSYLMYVLKYRTFKGYIKYLNSKTK